MNNDLRFAIETNGEEVLMPGGHGVELTNITCDGSSFGATQVNGSSIYGSGTLINNRLLYGRLHEPPDWSGRKVEIAIDRGGNDGRMKFV